MQLFVWISLILVVKESISWRVGQQKKWLPDLEWSTGSNWLNSKPPKARGRVQFPLELAHSVGLPSGRRLEISGIDLPRDGSLLLARDGRLQMDNVEKQVEIFKWKKDGPLLWADPENWSVSSQATPHFERIPCSTDLVELPDKNHSFSSRLPNSLVEVMEIARGPDDRLDEWSWQAVMSGREFRKSPRTVRYSGLQYCGDDCLCKPEMNDLLQEICSIQAPRCPKLGCEYPMRVEGHCCEFCGGRVSISNHASSLKVIDKLVDEALENLRDSVAWYCRVSNHANIQEVLVTEMGIYSGIKSQEATAMLTKILMDRGITIIESITTGARLNDSKLGNILGPLLGVPLVIILVIFAVLPYFGYSYSYIIAMCRRAYGAVREGIRPDDPTKGAGTFGFARFENVPEGDIQLASAVIPDEGGSRHEGENILGDDDEGGKRFENPLYGSTRRSVALNPPQIHEKIIDIDEPVSLIALQKKVYPTEETNTDSD